MASLETRPDTGPGHAHPIRLPARDEEAFLAAIRAQPGDLLPRLVYADWLDEHGDPRGEFIRVQCALASGHGTDGRPRTDETRKGLRNREQALLAEFGRAWSKPLKAFAYNVEFACGLPEHVVMWAKEFIAAGSELFARFPVRSLGVIDLSFLLDIDLYPEWVEPFFASPHLANRTKHNLAGSSIGPEGAEVLAASAHLANLSELRLYSGDIGLAGVHALAASPHFRPEMTIHLDDIRETLAELRRRLAIDYY